MRQQAVLAHDVVVSLASGSCKVEVDAVALHDPAALTEFVSKTLHRRRWRGGCVFASHKTRLSLGRLSTGSVRRKGPGLISAERKITALVRCKKKQGGLPSHARQE